MAWISAVRLLMPCNKEPKRNSDLMIINSSLEISRSKSGTNIIHSIVCRPHAMYIRVDPSCGSARARLRVRYEYAPVRRSRAHHLDKLQTYGHKCLLGAPTLKIYFIMLDNMR